MAENNTSGQKMLKVTLVKSPIRSRGVDKETVKTLGLRKIRQSHTLPDNPAVRGMIFSVKHLVSVEEV